MNIAFDISGIPAFRGGGIEMFVQNAFAALIHKFPNHQFYPLDLFGEAGACLKFTASNASPTYLYPGKNGYLRQFSGPSTEILGALIKSFIKKNNIDVFIITTPFLETPDIGYNAVYQKEWFEGAAVVSMLYDIIPYLYKDIYLSDKKRYHWYLSCIGMLRSTDGIIAISNSVKEDFCASFDMPDKLIEVAYLGASQKFYQTDLSVSQKNFLLNKFGITRSFILCSNSADWRKNSEYAIQAYSRLPKKLKEKYQLLVVGNTQDIIKRKYVKSSDKNNDIIFTGYVSDEELREFYNLATLVIFPSLYEGFGLPLIEAWKCGTPVISSNNSSLGELNFIKEFTFDPTSVDSISNRLEYALTEADLKNIAERCARQAEQFTWENTAKGMMNAVEKFANSKNELNKKLSITFVFDAYAKLPKSWESFFSMLAKRADITLVASEAIESWDNCIDIISQKQFLLKGALTRNGIVYCVTDYVSNTMLQTMKKHPGKLFLLNETLDQIVEYLFGDIAVPSDFALGTKLANYFTSNTYTVLDAQNVDRWIQGIILAGEKNKQIFASVSLDIPVYNVAPKEQFNGHGNQQLVDAFLSNLVVACTQMPILSDRKKAQQVLEDEIWDNAYTKQEARAFAKTVATAFSPDSYMQKIQDMDVPTDEDTNAIRIAMVSSWNTKCGIAEFTKYYCDALGTRVKYRVYPNRDDALLGPEDKNTGPRVWDYHGDVQDLARVLLEDPSHIVHIQYTEGFFTAEGLCNLVSLISPKKRVLLTCHNTKYLKLTSDQQRSVLNYCTFLVHQAEDRENLLGQGILSDNISIVPLGQPQVPARTCSSVRDMLKINQGPVIGSYGFLLPHKGILKVIQAVGQLKKIYPNILYIACCSFFNADVSHQYYQECVNMVQQLNLENNVKFVTDFLKPSESTYILQACDALVMAYDDSGESASGAIRFCIATKRPLVTTNYRIFKEFEDCTLQISDNHPITIAQAIQEVLSDPKIAQKYESLIERKIEKSAWETVTKQYLALYQEN